MEGQGPRKHRSRRNRPCDLCRCRKVACKIEVSPPCQFCASKGQQCTFEQAPGVRKRRRIDAAAPNEDPARSTLMAYNEDQEHGFSEELQDFGGSAELDRFFQSFELEHSLLAPVFSSTPKGPPTSSFSEVSRSTIHGSIVSPPPDLVHHQTGHQAKTLSIDGTRRGITLGTAYRYIGPSGDLDPFLLAHRSYDKHNASVSPYTSLTYQRVTPIEVDCLDLLPPALFTKNENNQQELDALARRDHAEDGSMAEFQQRIGDITASGLIALYLRFIHPYMPIISRHQLPTEEENAMDMPLCLLSAICATAIPFVLYDDALCVEASRLPTSEELFQVSWNAVMQETASPSLATLQAHLLLVHRHRDSVNHSRDASIWSHCCQIVSIAQTLGLNDDPSRWTTLPAWERRLRKRLWWAVWVTEKWTSFGQGMPSHLQQRSFTVKVLTVPDLADCEKQHRDSSHYFLALVQLTCILDDIVEYFFTMQASIQSIQRIENALQSAKMFRARLKNWHQSLPEELQNDWHSDQSWLDGSSSPRLNGNASLRMAFFTTQLAIFRALIRPISMDLLPEANSLSRNTPASLPSYITPQFISATIQGAVSALKDLVGFVGRLTTVEWDAYWPGWSQHNFALASTLLMHCYLITSICKKHEERREADTDRTAGLQSDALSDSMLNAGSTNNNSGRNEEIMASNFTHNEVKQLAQRWRWLLRLAARGAASKKSLMDRSLVRIDALFTEWNRAQALIV